MIRKPFNEGWVYEGRTLTLPHDAMLEAPRRADAPSTGAGAYFEGGVYTYEKAFTAPADWAGKNVLLQFEAVYRKSKVYLNGKEIGGAEYGYIPFFVPLEGLNAGGENTIKVVADNSAQPNSRWYAGGGIFRPVWLWVCEKNGLRPECVHVSTLSYSPARIRVDVDCGGEPTVEILDGGAVVAKASGSAVELDIPNAKLWSDETPYLYTCRVGLGDDATELKFGIRKVEWSTKGLFVNGKETLLRGGCIHHDGGILGAAVPPETEWRRVRILKEQGFNAIRSSHYPVHPAVLEACDALGVYVMDELWDMWYTHKTAHDYSLDFEANYKDDILAFVKRDYNHPSVIMYSIGNEVSEPAEQRGVDLAREMVDLLHTLDSSRAVTGGMNLMIMASAAMGNNIFHQNEEAAEKQEQANPFEQGGGMDSTAYNQMIAMVGSGMNAAAASDDVDRITSPVLDLLDIAGYNYANSRYPIESEKHPDRVLVGSETFMHDIAKNWAMVKKYPYLVGDFVWTAWDYMGETGIGAFAYTDDAKSFSKPYPWLLADSGALDITGYPTGEMFRMQAAWDLLDKPVIAVRPVNHPDFALIKAAWRGTNSMASWSWHGCDGNPATVEVFVNTDVAEVELMINGRSLGRTPAAECVATFETVFESGKVEAIAYGADGRELSRSSLESTDRADIHISAEQPTAKPHEVVYFEVTIGDGHSIECNADRTLKISVEGGDLLGFGSANPRTEERFGSGEYSTYYGRALAAVRVGSGDCRVTVTDGAASVSASVKAG